MSAEEGLWPKADWVPYSGPRGGAGWRNPRSGDVVYQREPPGKLLDTSAIEDDSVREEVRAALASRGFIETDDGGGDRVEDITGRRVAGYDSSGEPAVGEAAGIEKVEGGGLFVRVEDEDGFVSHVPLAEAVYPGGEQVVDTKEWVPYSGPQGGEGWEDTITGRVRYTEGRPQSPRVDPDSLSEDDLAEAEIQETAGWRPQEPEDFSVGDVVGFEDKHGRGRRGKVSGRNEDGTLEVQTERGPSETVGEDTDNLARFSPLFMGSGPAGAGTPWLPDSPEEPSRTQLAAEAARSAAATDEYGETGPLESFAALALHRGADESDVREALGFASELHPVLSEDEAERALEAGREAAGAAESDRELLEEHYDRAASAEPPGERGEDSEKPSPHSVSEVATEDEAWARASAKGVSEKGRWIPYTGPRGGTGWQDVESGDVVYQDDAPGLTVGDDPADEPMGEGDRVMLEYDGERHFGEVVATSKNGETVRVKDDRNVWTLDPDSGEQYGGDMSIVNLGAGESDFEDPETMEPSTVEELSYVLSELGSWDAGRKALAAVDEVGVDGVVEAAKDSGQAMNLLGSRMVNVAEAEVDGHTVSANADFDGAYDLREEFEERHPEHAEEAVRQSRGWEGAMYASPQAAPMVQAAMRRTGNETMPEYDRSDVAADAEVTDDQEQAAEAAKSFTVEKLREAFGDEVTLSRGFSPTPHGGTRSEGTSAPDLLREAKESGEEVEIGHRPLESWSLEPRTAKMYAGGEGAVITTTVPVEAVAASSSVGTIDPSENDTVLDHDGPEVYSPEEIFTGDELGTDEGMLRLRATQAAGMVKDDA